MKKVLIGLVLISSFVYAKVNAVVSILPQQTFLKAIGGDKVNVSLMVKPGNSPHTYEPKPSQMKDISKADLYFAIDIEFEKVWLKKFKSQNQNMKVVNVAKGIKQMEIQKHSHEEHGHEDEHKHAKLDPHVWVSPANVKIIAKNIYKSLVKTDNANKNYYKQNYKKFIAKVNKTDKKIKQILNNSHDAKFMVFHPAWGYFARDYHLEQIAIEAGGKSPKPKQLAHLIEEAKEENVKAVFTAPEFSESSAKLIAKEVGVPVIKISPLNPKWSKNLIKIATNIAK